MGYGLELESSIISSTYGYSIVDREDKVVVVWKSFYDGAEPPTLLRLDETVVEGCEKVQVLVADNQWCNGHEKLMVTREAIKGIEQLIEYTEVESPFRNRIIHLGYVGGFFLDGKAYRPYQLTCTIHKKCRCLFCDNLDIFSWFYTIPLAT
ncbi:MAG: hypothetical protein MUP98_01275 [Candidatus Aminicenantes bacterium]|nr:hypothetical protein [Candidatus Aminicenantes bacterium]